MLSVWALFAVELVVVAKWLSELLFPLFLLCEHIAILLCVQL